MLTVNLPSGYKYDFSLLNIKAMTFLEILDYMENAPEDPIEKLAFDYAVLKADDPNVDKLLITDLQYCFFVKQVMSINADNVWRISTKCPRCGRSITASISLDNMRFTPIKKELLNGLEVMLGGTKYNVRIPTVRQFMNVFQKYRDYRRLTDLRLIKIISLFDVDGGALNLLEMKVKNATHEQIKELVLLERLMLNSVNPVRVYCETCSIKHEPTEYELDKAAEEKGCKVADLGNEDIENIKFNYGGIDVQIDGLTSAVFQDVLKYNSIDPASIKYK